ncbi:MAG: DUF6702 family protein [Pseudomonadota bacterium]
MGARSASRGFFLSVLLTSALSVEAHPLRLSLSEIEYAADQQTLTISLRLFLMDVNEALVFDPDSTELAFCQPNESPDAERLLLEYLDRHFQVKANGEAIDLRISSKTLSGEGINVALGVLFEHRQERPLTTLEVKNAVFTDLFFDQSNIVYVHVNGESRSLMLNKETPTHLLTF